MPLKAPHLHFSHPFSTLPTSFKWRNQLQQRALASQISSLLLQRKDWIPFLKSRPSLLSHATPALILRILTKTQSNPMISLSFFQWAKANVGFLPDVKTLSKMVQILVDSNLFGPAKQLHVPVLHSCPAPAVVDSMLRVASCKDSRSRVLSFLLETYSELGLVSGSLEALKKILALGCEPSTRSCNSLLEALSSSDQIKTAWCSYAAVVRAGCSPDSCTWALLARLLCKEGKLERAVGLLGFGYCGVSTYDLVISCYCERGDFGAAISLLNGNHEKNLGPKFGIYSSILDGGCKHGDAGVIKSMVREMVVRGLLPTAPFLYYDWVITRFCELGKTYAAEMFFERARKENFELGKDSYVCMLRALSEGKRVEEAMKMYKIMLQAGVGVKPSDCNMFLSGICKGEPSEEADQVLKDMISGGFVPNVSDISKYIASQCSKGRWKEARSILDIALEKGILIDIPCSCSFVEHYCSNGIVDSAVTLHDGLKKLGGCLDVTSYDVLLKTLLAERRIDEAIQVFEYMQEKNVLDSSSFVIMIGALCHEKMLRKAMNLHDEMLKLRLKPDDATYKKLILISGFV